MPLNRLVNTQPPEAKTFSKAKKKDRVKLDKPNLINMDIYQGQSDGKFHHCPMTFLSGIGIRVGVVKSLTHLNSNDLQSSRDRHLQLHPSISNLLDV